MTSKNLVKIDSTVLSDYILLNYGAMSHLKLQKLLFYCDAYHLAYFDEELVTDKFQAWVHGPVSKKVFDSFKDKSILYADLSFVGDKENILQLFSKLTSGQQELINDVLSVLSQWTSMQLETSTHKEAPWIEARNGVGIGDRCCNEISKATTKSYYKSELGLV